MLSAGDSERVAALMRETAAAELVPRFRALAREDIRQKRPGDFVTVADEASEERLAAGLARILPGVPVVGEESVEKDPGLVGLIDRPGEACWIVDPLDGTGNFAAGKDRYAMIVALVQDRTTIAGWILDVPGGRMATAIRGQGVLLDGAPVRPAAPRRPLVGFIGYKIRKAFDSHLPPARRAELGPVSTLNCSGMEYVETLAGRADFIVSRRTKPWDHAAGVLMLEEAGGGGVRFDGQPYAPEQPVDAGLITAPDWATVAEVQSLYEAAQLPLLAGLPKT